jgi:hypothetical protein
MGAAPNANARFILTIDNKATSGVDVIIVDGAGAGISTPMGNSTAADYAVDGMIVFMGSVGAFTTQVTTAFSKPITDAWYFQAATIDLIDISATSMAAGELELMITDTYFLLPDQAMFPMRLTNSIGGTTVGTITSKGLLDVENQEFAMGGAELSTGILGPFNPLASTGWPAFSGTATSVGLAPIGSSHFSLTEIITLQHSGAGSTSFNKELKAVVTPEPGTLLLLGTGLIGLAGYGWRRRSLSKGGHQEEK